MFARAYADRLILEQLYSIESAMKLSELSDRLSNAGLGLAAVRSLLASNPSAFAYHERRWIPAARLEGKARPAAEAIRLIVERFGGPMPIDLITTELARMNQEEEEVAAARLQRMLELDDTFVMVGDGHVALGAWAFLGSDETLDRAMNIWRVDLEELARVEKALGDFDWRAPGAIAKALEKVAPVNVRTLGAAAWKAVNSQDPRAILTFDGRKFYNEAVTLPGYIYGPGGTISAEADAKKWLALAVKVADKLAPSVDVEDAAPIDVKPDDIKRMIKKIADSEATVTATRLLEEIYEITPANKTFPDDMANVMAALRGDASVWWVGGDRFRKPNSAPDFVYETPELFQFVDTTFKDAEGELIDVELTDEGLSSSLRKLLQHPLAMDVLDEDVAPAPKTQPEQVRLVLKSIHRELGTFPLAQIPTGWLDAEPSVQELILVDPSGQELQVWASHDARLLYNLIDWWFDQPVESGAVFTLTKTAKPNVLEFAWDDQPDPVVYISSQRMEELRKIQERMDELSALDILIEVMSHWPKGADFLTLLAEVNVVRRTSRRLVASLLSSYQCFYQRSGSPVWHYDAKKLELGFDKTKKKFIRK